LRLVYTFFFAPVRLDVPSGDAVGYDTLGWNIVQHHQLAYEPGKLTAHREPGYPLFLAGIYFLFGHSIFAVRLIQVLVSVLAVLVVYKVTEQVVESSNHALVASLMAAVYPSFVYYTATLLRETVFVFLLLLVVLVMINFFKSVNTADQYYWSGLAGITLGITSLTNSVTTVLLVGYLVTGLLLRKKVGALCLLLAVFVVVYSPWIASNCAVFNAVVTGSTNGGKTFWDGTDIIPYETRGLIEGEQLAGSNSTIITAAGMKSEVDADRYFYKQTFVYIRENTRHYAGLLITKFVKIWRFVPNSGRTYGHSNRMLAVISLVSYVPVFLLSLAGLFMIKWARILPLLIPLFMIPLVYALFWSQIRYRLPLESLLIILATIPAMKIIGFNK
jgi:4-amino-4-deoxy-L-arabinose transferase-like glycosyltransferase